MAMPEAPMNKDHFAETVQNDVWFTRDVFAVQAVAVSKRRKKAAN
jgi:hypothetical protein